MANRIVGNIYILDTNTSNLAFPNTMKITNVALYGIDTTSRLILTYAATTTDVIFALANQSHFPGNVEIHMGGDGFYVNEQLRVQSLVAGTGYIYFV